MTNINSLKVNPGTSEVQVGSLKSSGPITASGNISSSGEVYATTIYLRNKSILDYSTGGSEILRLGYNNDTNTIGIGRAGVTSIINLNAPVTASSDISSSGNILGHTGSFDYLESDRIIGHTGDTGTGIQFANDTTIINSNNVQVAKFRATAGTIIGSGDYPLSMSGTVIEIEGSITASGNISASGNINANRFDIDGNKFAAVGAGAFDIGQTGQASLNLTHITASGNISASGHISASFPDTNDDVFHYPLVSTSTTGVIKSQNSLKVNPGTSEIEVGSLRSFGDITASGNISSSDTVTANSASLSGKIDVAGRSKFGTVGASQASHHFKGVSGDANFFLIFDKDGEEVMKGSGAVGDGNLTYAFGDNAVAGNGVFFKIEDGNNRGFFKNDSNNAHFGINTETPGEDLEVVVNPRLENAIPLVRLVTIILSVVIMLLALIVFATIVPLALTSPDDVIAVNIC